MANSIRRSGALRPATELIMGSFLPMTPLCRPTTYTSAEIRGKTRTWKKERAQKYQRIKSALDGDELGILIEN